MKRTLATLCLALSLTACAHPNDNFGRNLAATVIVLGTIGAVTAAQQPQVIYHAPPVYPRVSQRQRRVVTSYDPCYQYGQAVQTYDQWGYPMGYQICR
jgi:uncharacterized PurR-regulated membrane protein YhhQ (DUF165 family)